MTETCSACGAEASGRFCQHCGAAISAACRECGNPLPKGARFCNMCGATAGPAPSTPARSSALPWVVAAVAVVALMAVLVIPRLGGRGEQPPASQPPFAQAHAAQGPAVGMPQGNPGAVDLSSMTPREAADRLFNRVMTAVSANDTAQALRFLPMAVAAYERVDSLDADGRYHLGALHLVSGQWAAARAQADTILRTSPTHLYGLFVAAQAEAGLGNQAAAKDFYRRFLQAYDAETAKKLPEYEEHAQGLPAMKAQAEQETR